MLQGLNITSWYEETYPPIKLDYLVFPKGIALGIIETVTFMVYRLLHKSWY